MTFELAVSTMMKTKEEVKELINKMNIHCNCIVINQCNENDYYEFNDKNIRVFCTTERGLSNSRNLAIKNANCDILGITDDDLFFYPDFDKKIASYYEKNTNADIVLFNIDSYNKEYPNYEEKIPFYRLGSFCSVQTTIKVASVRKNNILFDNFFGTGSKEIISGEENIFLADCAKKGLKIYYSPEKILKLEKTESSWFNGYNDSKFIFDRGAIYYRIWKSLSIFLEIRFAFSKRKLIEPFTFSTAMKKMKEGRTYYRNNLNESRIIEKNSIDQEVKK
ncbi:glycosyltransferase [Treponema sp.]|uniref:glycosyltransferase n=1 Tax=Treponema sp. TaxID=166 RepID=UPI0025799CF5|nr:glycosyltransferase [Treponema sp.]